MERTRNILGLSILTVLLTSCASNSNDQSQVPSNRHIYGVDCSGADVSISVCKDKAEKLCPDGYKVISKSEPSTSITDTALNDANSTTTDSSTSNKRGITIACD